MKNKLFIPKEAQLNPNEKEDILINISDCVYIEKQTFIDTNNLNKNMHKIYFCYNDTAFRIYFKNKAERDHYFNKIVNLTAVNASL